MKATGGRSVSLEIRRKAIHIGCIFIPLLYLVLDYAWMLWGTGVLLALAVVTEFLRMHIAAVGKTFKNYFGSLLRNEESRSITAATYLLLSIFLCILLFHKYIAIYTLIGFIAGDGMAGLIGRLYGVTPLFHKSLEGFLTCFITCLIIALIFPYIPFGIKLTGVFLISVVEVVPMRTNDNIRVPLISGSLMELIYMIYLRIMMEPGLGI
jgi:dolichol kinase